jgi:hypothetical protein
MANVLSKATGTARVSMASVVMVILALLPVATANAAGEYEPNDDIVAATGPMVGERSYGGTLETEQDEDWFWMPIAGQQQITFHAQFLDDVCWLGGQAEASLIDQSGKEITELDAIARDEDNGVQSFHYTTPPVAKAYYVRVAGASGDEELCRYNISVSPVTSVVAPPALNPVVSLGEPDNFKGTAHGPLSGEVLYAGTMETTGDIDQLYLEARPRKKLTLEMAAYGCGFQDGIVGDINLAFSTASVFPDLYPESDNGHWDESEILDTEGGGRLYIAIRGDANCDWQFWASPASALNTQPPAPPHHADPCAAAHKMLRRSNRSVRRLTRRLHHATSAISRGRIHHRIEARRRAIRAAKHSIRVHCT